MDARICTLFVLLACAGVARAQYTSISNAIQSLPETSALASLFDTTPLSQQFSNGSIVATAFAPNNAAMAALNKTLEAADVPLEMLTDGGDDSLLTDVLKYHVAPGAALKAAALKDGQRIKMADDEYVTVRIKNGKVTIVGYSPCNNVTVTKADVAAGKGVVHIINGVLIPSTYADLVYTNCTVTPDNSTASPSPSDTNITAPLDSPAPAELEASPSPSPSPSPSSAMGVSFGVALTAVPVLVSMLL